MEEGDDDVWSLVIGEGGTVENHDFSSRHRTDRLSDFLPPAVPFFHRAKGGTLLSLKGKFYSRNLCPESGALFVRRGADRSHHEYKFSLINRRRHQVAVERRVGWEGQVGGQGEGLR